jgi:hypothetical protein
MHARRWGHKAWERVVVAAVAGGVLWGRAIPAAAAEPPASAPASAPAPPAAGSPGTGASAGIEQIENPEVFTLWLNPDNNPRIERAVNVMNARMTRARALNFIIDHRTFEPFQKNSFHDFVGFDAGALKIGLALRYGILDRLEAGLRRLSNGPDGFDTYELDVKYWALRAEEHYVDVAARVGGTWYSQVGGPDRGGGFAQLLASRSFRERVWVATGLLYHSNATNDGRVDPNGVHLPARGALAIPLAVEWRFLRFLAWDVESVVAVAGYHSKYPVTSTALKFVLHRHTFALLFSNSQYVAADGIVANTSRGMRDLIVGFTITREFNL